MMIKPIFIALALLSTVTLVNAEGNAQAGREKSDTCLGCHGVKSYFNVYPSYKVPKLAGQHAEYLESALKAYRGKTRSHQSMQANAGNLSDQDIADIAAYFSSLKYDTPEENPAPNENLVALGKEKVATCAACHGQEGVSAIPANPTLAGQHPTYIAAALEQYKNGSRKNAIMSGMAAALTEEDMEAIAAFYGSKIGLQSATLPENFK